MRAVRRVSGRAGQAQMKFRYLIRENTKQDFYLAVLDTNKHTPFFSARADSWAQGFQITVGTQSAIAVWNPRSDSSSTKSQISVAARSRTVPSFPRP